MEEKNLISTQWSPSGEYWKSKLKKSKDLDEKSFKEFKKISTSK
jgi:hypothetical protein